MEDLKNDKKKILVLQLATKEIKYRQYSEEINSDYCSKNGYDYFCYTDHEEIWKMVVKDNLAIQWQKVLLLKNMMETRGDYDWYIFLDMDAIFVNPSERIETYCDDNYNLILGKDPAAHSIANTGVILVKNTEWSKKFLSDWWDSRINTTGQEAHDLLQWGGGMHQPELKTIFGASLWHEQTCLSVLYKKHEDVRNNIKIIDNRNFNSPTYYPDGFIFHAFAYALDVNRNLDWIHEAKFSEFQKLNRIVVVYFVYCVGNYLEVAKTDIERLKKSGLYNDLDEMQVVVSLPDSSDETPYFNLQEVYSGLDKVKFRKVYNNVYEHYGICTVWKESHKSDGQILYFHAKGVVNKPSNSTPHSEWKRLGDSSFIEMLKYYIIDNYKSCLEKLKTYDEVNTSDSYGRGWPSGNFWWANMSYIRKNSYPFESTYSRFSSEAWLTYKRTDYSCYQFYNRFSFRDKFTYIPEASYKNPASLSDKVINLISAKYMVLLEPENETDMQRPLETHEQDCTDFIRENLNSNEQKGFNNIHVGHGGLLGPNLIEDPLYGVRKVLVIEFTITDDDNTYRLVGDEGSILNYRIDGYQSEGYTFVDSVKHIIE
jgi:hypothetical protein